MLTIERVVAGGAGLAREADGRVVFVDGALPGEAVRVRITERKRDFARAVATDIVEASPDRVTPPCPHLAAGCGGCSWQHVAPTAQLALKADIVRDALRRTAKLPDADVTVAGAVPAWGYRTTLRLATSPDGRLGLRRHASHDVVTLDDCPVAHPALSALLPEVRSAGGDVTLRVSAATGEVTARGDTTVDLPGHLTETVSGVDLRVSAGSFFQSGPAAAELLVGEVGPQHGAVVDAYGGIGLFAATAASGADDVVVVESSPSACADARVNVPTATVVERRVERWRPTPADVVVADPARPGLQRDGAAAVAATGAPRIVLISCDPVSCARDVALLASRGYGLRRARVLDLFPHTAHVEVVSVLERD